MISRERWQQLQPILDRALDLPVEDVPAYLQRCCGDDALLRQEVERLLDAAQHDAARLHPFDVPVDRAAAAILSASVLQSEARAPLAPNQVVGPYRVVRRIGSGGMGVVYLAHDERLGRPVALKMLPPWLAADEGAMRRFMDEARAASALDHPNVGTIYDIGEAGGAGLYIAMAYYDGETLEQRIRRGPLPIEDACAIATQLAAGLRAAHAKAIVHRDIKPSNVILTPNGIAKLVDFGVAKIAGQALTVPGTMLGTVAYMSPEQTTGGEVDARADIWAVGAVMYEMVGGRRPFRAEAADAVIHAIRQDAPEPVDSIRPEVPRFVADAITRCLAKRPGDRFADAGALLTALDASGRPFAGSNSQAFQGRTGRWAAAAFIIALAGAAGALLVRGNVDRAADRAAESATYAGESDAHLSYLRGRYWLGKADPASYLKARDEFQHALDVDPTYAVAWAGLSDALEHMAANGVMASTEAYPRGRKAAERALELEPDLAEAHTSLAMVLTSHYWENDQAERHFRRAIELAPNYARAHRTYASHLRNHCRLDEALARARAAAALDPLDFFSHWETLVVLYFGRHHDDALVRAQRLVELNPADANLMVALARVQRREYEQALAALDQIDAHPLAPVIRGHVHGLTGRRDEARALLGTLDRELPDAGFARAVVFLGLDETDAALAALEHAYQGRSSMLRLLKGEPIFDPLRADPRFADLLKRVGFPDPSPCPLLQP